MTNAPFQWQVGTKTHKYLNKIIATWEKHLDWTRA